MININKSIKLTLKSGDKNKLFKYKLTDNTNTRQKTLNSYIKYYSKKYKISLRSSAIKKKARLNVLRVYRRNKHKKQCKIITDDMKWITNKYIKGGTVTEIC